MYFLCVVFLVRHPYPPTLAQMMINCRESPHQPGCPSSHDQDMQAVLASEHKQKNVLKKEYERMALLLLIN